MDLVIRNTELEGRIVDVAISEGRFAQIGRVTVPLGTESLNANGMAILPTFVNMHTHAAMSLLRGYADDLPLHRWLEEYIWPAEARLTEADVYHGTRLACLEMIKSGTTCFNDMYWHFHGTARAVEEMGLRAVLSAVMIDLNDPEKARTSREQVVQLFDEARRYSDRIQFALGPHAIYTVSQASLEWLRGFASDNHLLLHIHLSETDREVQECLALHGLRPVEWLEQIGFLADDVIAAHGVHLSDREIEILAQRGVKVVHNPTSNMKLASGRFSYKRLAEAGVALSLGTDGCASNNNLCMLEEMKMAALQAKLLHEDPTVLSAQEAFAMATENGARALRLDVGTIAVGKLADCMLIDRSNHRLAPGFRLIDDLVYSAAHSCIDTVICAGRVLMRGGRVEGEEEIVAAARRYVNVFAD